MVQITRSRVANNVVCTECAILCNIMDEAVSQEYGGIWQHSDRTLIIDEPFQRLPTAKLHVCFCDSLSTLGCPTNSSLLRSLRRKPDAWYYSYLSWTRRLYRTPIWYGSLLSSDTNLKTEIDTYLHLATKILQMPSSTTPIVDRRHLLRVAEEGK